MGLTKEPVDASGDSPAPSILRAGRGMGSKGTGPAGVRALGHTCKGGLCPEESAGASPQGCRRGAPGKIPPTLSPAHPSAQVCGQGGEQQARPPCCWGDRSPGPSPSAPTESLHGHPCGQCACVLSHGPPRGPAEKAALPPFCTLLRLTPSPGHTATRGSSVWLSACRPRLTRGPELPEGRDELRPGQPWAPRTWVSAGPSRPQDCC